MHVAYVCADAGVPVFGQKGCSIHVQEVIRSLIRRGVQVELLATRLGGEPTNDLAEVSAHEFRLPATTTTRQREMKLQELSRRIAAKLHEMDCDLVYERYSLWSSSVLKWARLLKVPSILEVNAPLVEEQALHRELIQSEKATEIARECFHLAGTIIAVSDEVAQYVCRETRDDPNVIRKLHVVPNGVDTNRFVPAVKGGSQSDEFVIGFVGTLKKWHGLESLIEAFCQLSQKHQSAKLRMIGDGPMRQELEAMIRARSLDAAKAVEWVGSVPSANIPDWLQTVDVAVAPYAERQGFYFSPLKVYEYMACGLPVVAGATGQLEKILTHLETGLLYEPGNVNALTHWLDFLATHPDQRAHLGRMARRQAEQKHSWEQAVAELLQLAEVDQSVRLSRMPHQTIAAR